MSNVLPQDIAGSEMNHGLSVLPVVNYNGFMTTLSKRAAASSAYNPMNPP